MLALQKKTVTSAAFVLDDRVFQVRYAPDGADLGDECEPGLAIKAMDGDGWFFLIEITTSPRGSAESPPGSTRPA